jgi:two-component system, NtrC family, sensor histidine kinase PilS
MRDFDRAPTARNGSPLYQLTRAGLVAGGLLAVIFGVYEIVERQWLQEVDQGTLFLLHRLRGIVGALAASLVVGWMVLRSSPALRTVTSIEEQPPSTERLEQARTRLYASWFIGMRWIAVLVAAIFVFLGAEIFNLVSPAAAWRLNMTVVVLALSNILYTVWIHRTRRPRQLLVFQGYMDLAILTVLLSFAGGITNPLAAFMLFHVIIGGILLSRAQCYLMAGAGALLFMLLAFGEYAGWLRHYPLHLVPSSRPIPMGTHFAHLPFVVSAITIQTSILFLTAYFVTTLSDRLRRSQRRLGALAEKAMAERRLLEQALETTSTALRVLTRDLSPVWSNDRWREWFGTPRSNDGAAGEQVDLCPGRDALLNGGNQVCEIERRNSRSAPGNETTSARFYEVTTAPLFDARGELTQVVQLAHDITSQKAAHSRMLRAGQMAAVGELAGQVAHEVNNPIAIISAKGNLLLKHRRGEMSEKIAEELAKMVDLSNRVARIAQALLSYSRPSPTTRVPLDLRSPIHKSLYMIEHQARNCGITIEDRLPDRPLRITANAAEMEQVFLNLLLNAVQAMAAGGRLRVSVIRRCLESSGDEMIGIAVDDTGSGVPLELRERVFEPFFTTKHEMHGTGLGLSICQGLMRSHGGEIAIEDSPLGGARFIVWLPEKPPVPAEVHPL